MVWIFSARGVFSSLQTGCPASLLDPLRAAAHEGRYPKHPRDVLTDRPHCSTRRPHVQRPQGGVGPPNESRGQLNGSNPAARRLAASFISLGTPWILSAQRFGTELLTSPPLHQPDIQFPSGLLSHSITLSFLWLLFNPDHSIPRLCVKYARNI